MAEIEEPEKRAHWLKGGAQEEGQWNFNAPAAAAGDERKGGVEGGTEEQEAEAEEDADGAPARAPCRAQCLFQSPQARTKLNRESAFCVVCITARRCAKPRGFDRALLGEGKTNNRKRR